MSQTASDGVSIDAPTHPQPTAAKVKLEAAYAPIVQDLKQVESILRRELNSQSEPVDQLLEHSWLLGGKRIRPVLLLLSGAASGRLSPAHHSLAAALEMIHTATLVHDDILDNAKTRRHRPTANTLWGIPQSVLLGDYLFTHAFHLASQSGSCEALGMLAAASNRVCEGEIRQNAWQGEFDLTEAEYLQMITEKTAELCGVGCQIGAFLSGADPNQVQRFSDYGRNLGVAFQIIDDVLDLVGQPSNVGKTLGTDLLNQKPTLPVIHALEVLKPERRAELKQLLVSGKGNLKPVLAILKQSDSLEYSRQRARDHAQAAIEFARSLTASQNASSMEQLAHFVLQRTY